MSKPPIKSEYHRPALTKKDWYNRVYQRSLAWKQTRQDYMSRVGWLCEQCKVRRAVIVHHVSYERLFYERPEDLKALCRFCHDKIHRPQAANDNQQSLDLKQITGYGLVMKKLPDEIKHDLFFDDRTGEWFSVPKENDNDNDDGGMQETG